MINVTYAGDTLYAHKITGDENVPKGAITFKADLSPTVEALEPIELGQPASRQWGTKYLSRFAGEGQVSAEGFRNPQFIEGQLILVNEFFSFAWVPIGHQVFFGRPSPELTLRLMRKAEEGSTETEKQRLYLNRCMEETAVMNEDDGGTQNTDDSTQTHYYDEEGCFE